MGFIVYTFLLSQLVLGHIGLAQLFKKAGVKSWKAYVPFLNAWEWIKLIEKPKYWIILLILPIFNIFTYLSMVVDLIQGFNHRTLKQEIVALLFPGYYFFIIGRKEETKWYGIVEDKKSDWAESIIFALYAATLIRWSTFEPYMIPTSSMEGSLLVGDFLFVSKMHYGPRTPMTPLQVPLTHQTFPWVGKDKLASGDYTHTYLNIPALRLPYFRLPGFGSVKRNDVVVFNFPGYDKHYNEMNLPPDLRTNYIKRCVAQAGDTLSQVNAIISVNGTPIKNHENTQHNYLVHSGANLAPRLFDAQNVREYNQRERDKNGNIVYDWNIIKKPSVQDKKIFRPEAIQSFTQEYNLISKLVKDTLPFIAYHYPMDKGQKTYFEGIKEVNGVTMMARRPRGEVEDILFYEKAYNPTEISKFSIKGDDVTQNVDNFSPFVIPFEGMTIKLTDKNRRFLISHYGYLIEYYDRNKDGEYIVNDKYQLFKDGKEIQEYTFNQNYYFMIGDNRHQSLDSRYWGFVPEDHIVGKALFVWFSRESGLSKPLSFFESIRWNRIFKAIE